MIPSRRLYALLVLIGLGTVALYVITQNFGWIPLMLALDLLLLGLGWWDSRQGKRITVERSPLDRLSIGRDNPVTLTVAGGYAGVEVDIVDAYPPEFGAAFGAPNLAPHLSKAQGSAMPLQLNRSSEVSETLTYTVHPTQRGEYAWGDLFLRQRGPWGLAWRQWKQPQAQKVAVYPDLVGLRSLSIRLTQQSAGSIRRAKRLGTGTEFAELRDYAMGDDPRFIDWKATARRGTPLVRVLEPEQEQTLIILLDRGRLMTAQVKGLLRFDWGLNAALGLAMAGISRGDRVGIGVFDREMHLWMPPERGQKQYHRMLERLTPIQPDLLEPDYLGAVTQVVQQQTRRALVVMLTDLVDQTASAELMGAMTRLAPRYLPFCVALRDPQVDGLAHQTTTTVADTYSRAVALDLLNQRQLAFAQLKRKGVLVLDAPAHQISEPLVDRYLMLKAQNRL
jgi:uncharacterized protein (DUF58 family)